jgi:hypothetical protein
MQYWLQTPQKHVPPCMLEESLERKNSTVTHYTRNTYGESTGHEIVSILKSHLWGEICTEDQQCLWKQMTHLFPGENHRSQLFIRHGWTHLTHECMKGNHQLVYNKCKQHTMRRYQQQLTGTLSNIVTQTTESLKGEGTRQDSISLYQVPQILVK